MDILGKILTYTRRGFLTFVARRIGFFFEDSWRRSLWHVRNNVKSRSLFGATRKTHSNRNKGRSTKQNPVSKI